MPADCTADAKSGAEDIANGESKGGTVAARAAVPDVPPSPVLHVLHRKSQKEEEGEGECRCGGVPGGDAPGPHHLVWKLPFRPARSDQNFVVFNVLHKGLLGGLSAIARSGKVRLHKLISGEGLGDTRRGYRGATPQWVRLDGRGKLLCTAYYDFVPLQPGEKPPPSPTRTVESHSTKRGGGNTKAAKKVLGWSPPGADRNRLLFWAVGLLILLTSVALGFLAQQRPAELRAFFSNCHAAIQATARAHVAATAVDSGAAGGSGGGSGGGDGEL